MNDSELKAMLRGARVPERDEYYWNDFPGRVIRQVGRAHRRLSAPSEPLRWFAPLVWGASIAVACVVLGFLLARDDRPSVEWLLTAEEQISRRWHSVPAQLCVIVQENHGVSDQIVEFP